MTSPILDQVIALAKLQEDVEVVWLYGSHAKGNAGSASDIDLAVAFNPVKLENDLETRLRPEILADDWCRALGLPDKMLSVVDINIAPIPLAFEVINANSVLLNKDDGSRRLWEEGRIMSRMEIDVEYQANAFK